MRSRRNPDAQALLRIADIGMSETRRTVPRWSFARAVRAGKASLIPRYGPYSAPSPAEHEALQYLDRIADRLAVEARG
jgi:hypothetical protein